TVKIGDEVRVFLPGTGEKIVEVRAILAKRVSATLAAPAFVDLTPPPLPREERVFVAAREPGAGRPTKRDRRDIGKLRGY
ncbi:MAG: hslR, partial [Schumannella sp.]|nr:hslR [Schumannella sp.]